MTVNADGAEFKGGVHAVTAALAAAMGLYNLMEWSRRREARLALNALLYGTLWGFEVYQTYRHFRAGGGPPC